MNNLSEHPYTRRYPVLCDRPAFIYLFPVKKIHQVQVVHSASSAQSLQLNFGGVKKIPAGFFEKLKASLLKRTEAVMKVKSG